MKTLRKYRNNGAVGALLDEYEKVIDELITTISGLEDQALVMVVDPETPGEDCRSIQTVLAHVVQSGYTYAVEIRKWLGESAYYRNTQRLTSERAYAGALREMFQYTEQLFLDHPDLKLTEYDNTQKLVTRWGQTFDIEQLMQHAIVHILRHRRQIERFKLKLAL